MKTKQRAAAQAEGYIVLTFKVHKEEDQYVSECMELGVGSQGDTLDDAFTAIEEATALYLSTLEDLHERERVFSERGIKLIRGEPKDSEGVSLTAQLREYISPKAMRIPAIA